MIAYQTVASAAAIAYTAPVIVMIFKRRKRKRVEKNVVNMHVIESKTVNKECYTLQHVVETHIGLAQLVR